MNEKIVGYLLLIVGIGIIIFSGFDVYQVFTKQKQPVKLFNFSGISIDLSKLTPQASSIDLSSLLPEGVSPDIINELQQSQKPQTGSSVMQEIVSRDMVNQPMNLFGHLMLMGFISTAGLKLATIGTYLLRPVNVHLKEEKKISTPSTP